MDIESAQVPVLQGENHCRHSLCSPCVIDLPPSFLRGACGPHPAKRHRLYRLFWKLLKDIGVRGDKEYLQRKEGQTVRDDRRESSPHA